MSVASPPATRANGTIEADGHRSGHGSLDLVVARRGERSVLERVRYDGIVRCSRRFAVGDAALVVLSQLGPGVMRGDHVRLTGRLRENSRLIVTSQTATRLLGGARRAVATADWTAERGALLEIVGEPLVGASDAAYTGTTTITLREGARAAISDIVGVPAGADVRVRLSIRRDDRELLYDAIDAAAAAPATVGTFALVGIEPAAVDALAGALDVLATTLPDVRIGIGLQPAGAFVRLTARDPWAVRSALAAIRETARASLREPEQRQPANSAPER